MTENENTGVDTPETTPADTAAPEVKTATAEVAIDAPSSENQEDKPSRLLDFTPATNVTASADARITNTKDAKRPRKYDDTNSLSFVNGTAGDLDEHAQRNYPNLNIARGSQGEGWVEAINSARQHFMHGEALLSTVLSEDNDWRQSITAGAEQLQAGRPKFEPSEDGAKLTGEQALIRLQTVLGLGAIVRIPLWHSGLWVSLKAPTEAALLELDRRIGSEKINLGRLSSGLIFSNTSVYTASYLVNFVLAHVYEVSYKYSQETTREQELKSVILSTDIPTLIWGLLCTIYPNGYPHREPCVRDPTTCLHVVEEMINIGKLAWTNDRALTDAQRRHMTRKTAKFTKQELQTYQEQHRYMNQRTVQLHDAVSMDMRVPTVAEYEQAGFAWVDGIVQQIDKSYGNTVDENTRNDYITEQGLVTALRQYVHWVDRLVLNETNVIDDRATLEDTLATLSANESVYEKFFDGIGKFIDATTISLIALPKYDCPSCGEPMNDAYKLHPHLVPIDVVSVFFTLLGQRITSVLYKQKV